MIFTIGHSNHEIETFIDLLIAHEITAVADVRSHPVSPYTPHFNADALSQALRQNGIAYVSLGNELGGRPQGGEFYDPDGHVLYGLVAESPIFLSGIHRIVSGCPKNRIALMCSEEDPTGCHRHLLVSRVLVDHGIAVTHIRGDGELMTYNDLTAIQSSQHQPLLFEEMEPAEWRSIQSVLPRKKPASSSTRSGKRASSD